MKDPEMNIMEELLKRFFISMYDSQEHETVFELGDSIYQFLNPTSIIEGIWHSRDDWGYDLSEVVNLVGDGRHSTDDILRMMEAHVYRVSEVTDIIKEGHFIKGIIELSDVDPWSEMYYIAVVYSRQRSEKVKVCDYRKRVEYPKEKDDYNNWSFLVTDPCYKEYLNCINKWICNDGDLKPSDGYCSNFYFCSYEDLPYFFEHFKPRLLNSENLMSRKELQRYSRAGKTRALGEISKIIRPRRVSNEPSLYPIPELISALLPKDVSGSDLRKHLGKKNTTYELNVRTDTRLHKGDYYVSGLEPTNWFPILEEPTEAVYAEEGALVVRVNKEISLEYLFLYFDIGVGRIAVDLQSTRDLLTQSRLDNIELIQVVLPDKDLSYYADMVSDIFYNDYQVINNRLTFRQKEEIQNLGPNTDLMQLKYYQLVKLGRHTNLRRMVLLDIDEVYRCKDVKAYKAAIILCGGILEAVLTDWISEIDGIDYFQKTGYDYSLRKNYYGTNKEYFHDKNGNIANPELVKIIDRIDGLKPPVWINNEKQFATIIRQERNKVHAGLAISDPVITEEQCTKVMDYLVVVLKTRGLIV